MIIKIIKEFFLFFFILYFLLCKQSSFGLFSCGLNCLDASKKVIGIFILLLDILSLFGFTKLGINSTMSSIIKFSINKNYFLCANACLAARSAAGFDVKRGRAPTARGAASAAWSSRHRELR
jgi:hypothetical protein